MDKFNVVIVGGGAAGLYVAGLLGKEVSDVCLLDSKRNLLEMPFHTLGSFIDKDQFELSEKVIAADITELALHSKRHQTIKNGAVHVLNKKQLHRELLELALKQGVTIKNPVHIRTFKQGLDGTVDHLVDSLGNEYDAKIFIDASGVAGVLSRPLGIQDQKFQIAVGLEYNVKYLGPQNRAHLFIGKNFRGGYGWIFPLGDGRAIFGFGTFDKNVVARLKEITDKIISMAPINRLIEKDNSTPYGGTIPVTGVKNKFVFKNVVCIGDSISQVHPLVGEGYRFVLNAGKLAAPHILNALKQNDMNLLGGYEEEWSKNFLSSYKKGKTLQNILKFATKNDLVCDTIVSLISRLNDNAFMRLISGGV